jgi:hypothetical protein
MVTDFSHGGKVPSLVPDVEPPTDTAQTAAHLVQLIAAELEGLLDADTSGVIVGKDLIFRDIAERYGIDSKSIAKDYARLQRLRQGKKTTSTEAGLVAQREKRSPVARKLTPEELDRGRTWGRGAVYMQFNTVLRKLGCHIHDPITGFSIFDILLCRLLPYGTTHYIYGASSAGKSYVFKKALSTLPCDADYGLAPSDLGVAVDMTSMSKQAINYMGSLKNRILYLGEVKPLDEKAHDDDVQMQLRQLHSEDRIRRAVPERPASGGPFQLVFYETEGPAVQVGTTTRDPQDYCDENDNRTLWLPAEDSPAAVDGKLAVLSKADAEPWIKMDEELLRELEDLRLYWLSLESMPVWMWFAPLVRPVAKDGEPLPATATRLYEHLKTYINCSALANQHKRQRVVLGDGKTYLFPERDDFEMAFRLLERNAPRPLQQLPNRAKAAWNRAGIHGGEESAGLIYTRPELTKLLKTPEATVKKWLPRYVDAGLLTVVEQSKGMLTKYRLGSGRPTEQALNLVSPDEISKEQWEEWRSESLGKSTPIPLEKGGENHSGTGSNAQQ